MREITHSRYWQCILDADDNLNTAIDRLFYFDDVESIISGVDTFGSFPHVHAILRFSHPVKLDDVMSRLHVCGFSPSEVRQVKSECLRALVEYISPVEHLCVHSTGSYFHQLVFGF